VTKIAILNDYQGVALASADWSVLPDAEIEVFREAFENEEAAAIHLLPFEVVCLMRERTRFPRSLMQRLPNLKLLVTTGMRNASVDAAAAKDLGIVYCGTGGPPRMADAQRSNGTAELTWGHIIGLARRIPWEDRATREGHWELTVGDDLVGKTLSVLGLGNIGSFVAKIGNAFGMNVIAWSQNLTPERAEAAGARYVSKEGLFAEADYLTVHLVLSERTRGLVGAADIARMKPTAYLINTSRGPIVDEAALLAALRERRIAGAGLDTFDVEPLPAGHPFLSLDNVLLTPHLGFVTKGAYAGFYGDTVDNIAAYLKGSPIRVIEPS
jgi:phosphoglycerate dehydrogenase-like enzyme